MMISLSVLLLLTIGFTTSRGSTDCFCTEQFEPVCGSNGKTYPNKCHLTCAQIEDPDLVLDHDGCCEVDAAGDCVYNMRYLKGCFCTDLWQPVCGSDKKTYSNKCYLACARIENPDLVFDHNGCCKEDAAERCGYKLRGSTDCFCTDEYAPVCGSNGKTYPNKCHLICAQIEDPDLVLDHDGCCEVDAEGRCVN